jgi:hypothetical protein
MYSIISTFQELIIDGIGPQDVTEYDWLCQHVREADTAAYQQRYKNFWGMNVAQLSSGFYATYFNFLKLSAVPALKTLCQTLFDSSTRRDGRQTLQFSFATKLLHTLDPRLPIYDSFVARFFLFEPPSSDCPLSERIGRLIAFHDFLIAEYRRLINGGHLETAISTFRQRLNPQQQTDEKIIDWLLWSYVDQINRGALLKGTIVYQSRNKIIAS